MQKYQLIKRECGSRYNVLGGIYNRIKILDLTSDQADAVMDLLSFTENQTKKEMQDAAKRLFGISENQTT